MSGVRSLVTLGLILTLGACGAADRLRPGSYGKALRSERTTFEGIYFRAKLKHTSEDRRNFAVTVPDAARSINGAYQAADFEAVKYCLGLFGGSDHSLDATPEDAPQLDAKGSWTISGMCTVR